MTSSDHDLLARDADRYTRQVAIEEAPMPVLELESVSKLFPVFRGGTGGMPVPMGDGSRKSRIRTECRPRAGFGRYIVETLAH